MTRLQKQLVGLWVVLMLVGGGLALAIRDDSRGGRQYGWFSTTPTKSPDPCRPRIPSPAPTGTTLVICTG
ncbi:hypothetical protein ACFC1R_18320 [Kitasatospora sp. NPDC056138]|uniref:hypothetical protein n=1 Tax=Kitasatospora sp. NPDC056138 TaxID=3345724 RepID=UPI0035D87B98